MVLLLLSTSIVLMMIMMMMMIWYMILMMFFLLVMIMDDDGDISSDDNDDQPFYFGRANKFKFSTCLNQNLEIMLTKRNQGMLHCHFHQSFNGAHSTSMLMYPSLLEGLSLLKNAKKWDISPQTSLN